MKMVLITDLVTRVDKTTDSDKENTLCWLSDWMRYSERNTVFGTTEICSRLVKLSGEDRADDFLVKKLPTTDRKSFFGSIVRPFQAFIIAVRFLLAARKSDRLVIHYSGGWSAVALFLLPLFSATSKTVIYDRNWGAGQSRSRTERMLRLLLRWKFFTKKSQILIYNEPRPNQTAFRSIVQPLYEKRPGEEISPRKLSHGIKFLHTGGLNPEFQPLLACKLIRRLVVEGYKVELHFYCEGNDSEVKPVEEFIKQHKLQDHIHLHSNQNNAGASQIYSEAHFFLYLARDAAWPISMARAMSWGCLPVATPVGCVPGLIGDELERGILTIPDPAVMASNLKGVLNNEALYAEKVRAAIHYSANFSPDAGRREIKQILST